MIRSRVLLATLGLVASLACRPGTATIPAAGGHPGAAHPPATLSSGSYPPPWTHAEITGALRDFSSRYRPTEVPREPSLGAPQPPLVIASDAVEHIPTDAFHVLREKTAIEQGARGRPVELHDLWLRRRPTAVITKDGSLTVRWETLRPMAGGRLSVGAYVYGSVLRQAILRASQPLEPTGGTHHAAQYPIRALVRAKYDVQETRATGRGQFIYRIQMLDPATGAAVIEDGRVNLRCHPVPCERGAEFVQLPTMVLGPFLDLVGPRAATVSFVTDVPTAAEVWVRDREGTVLKTRSPQASTKHEIRVTGLAPGEAYRYMVVYGDTRGELAAESRGTLRTSSDAPYLRVAVMSDSRAAYGVATAAYHGVNRAALTGLVTQAFARGADLIVFAGDLIDGYTTVPGSYARQLDAWRESVESVAMHIPIYEAMGNHELLSDAWSVGWMSDRAGQENSETLFARAVVNPRNGPAAADGAPPYEENVYSFDRGPVHFVVLNTNYAYRSRPWRTDHPAYPRGHYEGEVTDAQLAWLDEDLSRARARGADHLLVFAHEPAFPNGGHVHDAMYYSGRFAAVLERRRRFWSLLVKHRVLAAFFGDEHNYSRTRVDSDIDPTFTKTVWQIITGGAGAPFYAQDRTVPWVDNVERFEHGHHFVMLDIAGDRVTLEARDAVGQVRDRVVLTEASPTSTPGRR